MRRDDMAPVSDLRFDIIVKARSARARCPARQKTLHDATKHAVFVAHRMQYYLRVPD